MFSPFFQQYKEWLIKMIVSLKNVSAAKGENPLKLTFPRDIWKWNNHSVTSPKLKRFRWTWSTPGILNICYCSFQATGLPRRCASLQAFHCTFTDRKVHLSGLTSFDWSGYVKIHSLKFWFQKQGLECTLLIDVNIQLWKTGLHVDMYIIFLLFFKPSLPISAK